MPQNADVAERAHHRFLFVVARDRVDIYQHLHASFGDVPEVTVVLDRRRRERRQASVEHVPERRRGQRRTARGVDIAARGWAVVRVTRPTAL